MRAGACRGGSALVGGTPVTSTRKRGGLLQLVELVQHLLLLLLLGVLLLVDLRGRAFTSGFTLAPNGSCSDQHCRSSPARLRTIFCAILFSVCVLSTTDFIRQRCEWVDGVPTGFPACVDPCPASALESLSFIGSVSTRRSAAALARRMSSTGGRPACTLADPRGPHGTHLSPRPCHAPPPPPSLQLDPCSTFGLQHVRACGPRPCSWRSPCWRWHAPRRALPPPAGSCSRQPCAPCSSGSEHHQALQGASCHRRPCPLLWAALGTPPSSSSRASVHRHRPVANPGGRNAVALEQQPAGPNLFP